MPPAQPVAGCGTSDLPAIGAGCPAPFAVVTARSERARGDPMPRGRAGVRNEKPASRLSLWRVQGQVPQVGRNVA